MNSISYYSIVAGPLKEELEKQNDVHLLKLSSRMRFLISNITNSVDIWHKKDFENQEEITIDSDSSDDFHLSIDDEEDSDFETENISNFGKISYPCSGPPPPLKMERLKYLSALSVDKRNSSKGKPWGPPPIKRKGQWTFPFGFV